MNPIRGFFDALLVWILDCIRMPLAAKNHFQSERLKIAEMKPQRQSSDVGGITILDSIGKKGLTRNLYVIYSH